MTGATSRDPDDIAGDELGLLLYLCDPRAFERTMGRKPTQFDFLCRAYEAYLHIMSCNFNRVKFHSLCAAHGLRLTDLNDDPSGVIIWYFGRFFSRSTDTSDLCDFDSDAQLHCTLLRHGHFAGMSYETFREFVHDLGDDLQADHIASYIYELPWSRITEPGGGRSPMGLRRSLDARRPGVRRRGFA
jgi:hypothetical protein